MIYFLSFFLLFSNIAVAQKLITFESENQRVKIDENITFLKDTKGELSIKDILKKETQAKFQTVSNLSSEISNHNTTLYWLKFTVSNQSNQDAWLAMNETALLLLDFYATDSSGNYVKLYQTGSLKGFENRPYPIMSGFWFPLNKAKESQAQTYYIRLQSRFVFNAVFEISTLSQLHQAKTKSDNLNTAFIGLMLFVVLYNLFRFFSTKDSMYFMHTGYVIFATLVFTFLNSYPLIEYLTGYQLQTFLHYYFSVWSYPMMIFSSLFCIQYLGLDKRFPQAKKVIIGLTLSQTIIIFLNFSGLTPSKLLVYLEQLVPLILYITCLFISAYLLFFKKLKRSRYYLVGWSFFVVGFLLLLLSINNFIPHNIYIKSAGYLGIGLEVYMFSLALGDRLTFLQKENERIQAKTLSLVEQQKESLEEKVRQRTTQLEDQKGVLNLYNSKLEKKHAALLGEKEQLQRVLEENKQQFEQIERQKLELEAYNESLTANHLILKEKRDKLKKTVEENKQHIAQIEEQKQKLYANNEELQTKEEELRQNLEALATTQETLEQEQIKLKLALARNQSITHALDKSVIVSITDLKGNILEVNKNFCEITGYDKQELIGQNQSIVNSGHHPKTFWKEMWRTIGTGSTWRGEIKNKSKQGVIYWVDSVISPMYNEEEKLYSYLSIRYPITERKQAAEQIEAQKEELQANNEELVVREEELRHNFEELQSTQELLESKQKKLNLILAENHSIMHALNQSVLTSITDLKGNILETNQIFCDVSGYKKEELIGQNQSIVNSGHHPKEFWRHMWQTIGEGHVWRQEIKNKRKDGITYWVDAVISPMYDEKGQIYRYLSIRYIITNRKETEAKIIEQHKKIVTINKNLNDSIDYAQSIQQAILPNIHHIKKYLPESFIFFRPRDIVSGDFYFFAHRNYKLVIAAVDCTGHGIPGAFMSMIGNQILHEIVNVKGITRPSKILNMLREGIIRVLKQKESNNQDGMDIAVCTIDAYPETAYEVMGHPHLEYAGAKNQLLYFQENKMFSIGADKIIIGGFQNYSPQEKFTLHRIPLNKPTTFYIFSDGIQDQFGGEQNKKFSTRRLKELLQEIHHKDMEEQEQILSVAIQEWQNQGNENQIDDMLLIGVKV